MTSQTSLRETLEQAGWAVRPRGNELHLTANLQTLRPLGLFLQDTLGLSLATLFATDERTLECGGFVLRHIFSAPEAGTFVVVRTPLPPGEERFPSLADRIHAASCAEREVADLFGLVPEGHPQLKPLVFHSNWPEGVHPLRRDYDRHHKPPYASREIPFLEVGGSGVYEIPVGPVHAGIIEPGHFRFSVAGEPVINLEAQLFFVHKGIEKLCEGMPVEKALFVAERISGDESFTNALAFCQALESIAGVEIPPRAAVGRVIFAELERLTSHLGDLAGICLDTAYGFGAFQFRMLRGWAYQMADMLCGMRFLRSLNAPGGLRRDFFGNNVSDAVEIAERLRDELQDTTVLVRRNGFLVDRIENTGILSRDTARDLHATGPGGRASGLPYDVRKAYPYAAYPVLVFDVPCYSYGDVACRMNVKLDEARQSVLMILQGLGALPPGGVREELPPLPPFQSALGATEAPRGENLHWILTGEENTIFRYKIRTPSFCNWPALCHAVKGNIVPDFPLINKSFNLSYAGNDL